MSKINTQYWGANVSPYEAGGYTYSYGISTNNIRALLQANKYDPNTDSFDMSVSPWGIGYSAAGNRGQIAIQRQGSVDGNSPGVITKISFEGIDRENTNRPFYIPTRDVGGMYDNYNWIMSRVGGDCKINNDYYLIEGYKSQVLAGNSTSSNCISNQYPCTFLDYQHFKLAIRAFNYINLDTGVISQYSFVENNVTPENAKTKFNNYNFPEHMAITTIYVSPVGYAMQVGSPTQWTSLPTPGGYGLMQMRGHTIGDAYLFNRIGLNATADTKYKLFAGWNLGVYGVRDTVNTYYALPRDYYTSRPYVRTIPVKGADYRPAPNDIDYIDVQVDGLGVSPNSDYDTTFVSNYCDKEQSFSDIKYKQRPLLYTQDNGFTEIKEGFALSTSNSQFRATSIYEVSGSDTFTKAQILALIKHEVAFYGFEFYIGWGNSTGGTFEVGSDDLFLPKFDKHLITTGMYTSGTASLSEPNATWGNVFGDDMPKYEYNYNPSPGNLDPLPDEDGGLINMRHYRDLVLLGSNQYYAMSGSELIQFITDINGQYADTQPIPSSSSDLEQRLKELQYSFFQKDVNWKGSNPNDYIVGVYAYPFSLPHATSITGVKVGPVTTSVSANIVETRRMLRTTYGEIEVRGSGNFLDYAPYTQLQLYLPMLGIVELDPAYYVGAELSVDYIMDINTGSLSGIVYRNGTIDKVIEGSVAAQVPITARDMGDYQNAVQQAKQALMSSVIGGTQKGASVITGMVQTGASSAQNNNPMAALSTNIIDLAATGWSIGQNIGTSAYNLTHMSPNVSTVSTASSANSMQLESTAVLMYRYAKFLPEYNSENYGHTVGFACCINDTIGTVEGFTVATDIDTSGIPATAEEIQMIRQAFANGVYV